MPLVLLPNASRVIGAVFALVACALSACHHTDPAAPLPPDLAAVQCPAGQGEHAIAHSGSAQLTYLCIEPQPAARPQLLTCDRNATPGVCDGTGAFILRHDAHGVVYGGPRTPDDAAAPGAGPTDDSELQVYFQKGPPRQPTFDVAETQWRFLLADAKDALPSGFTFVKGAWCDRAATPLNTGTCTIEATTPSLYWNITISLRHAKDTPIPASEYRGEFRFWMKYLGEMAVDPKT